MSYNTARQHPSTTRSYNALQQDYLKGRQEGMKLFEEIKKLIITDYMVFTTDMRFTASEHRNQPPEYAICLRNRDGSSKESMDLDLHPHSFSKMLSAVSISKSTSSNMGMQK